MDEDLARQAVAALQAYHLSCKEKGKRKLIEDSPTVSLIIALKKIPPRTVRPHRIPLSHTLYPLEETEMCLITKDDKSSVKTMLEERGVAGVNKVIPIAKLKTNYKSFELKRRLSDSYDLFLVDKRLYHTLPHLLGKKFFEKKKYPLPVDVRKKDFAAEVRKARDATYLHVGLGNCCAVPVGKVGFPVENLVENVLQAMKGVVHYVPGGWKNVQSVHVKSVGSIALPVYNSLPLPPTKLSQAMQN